jgi:hypothetical protein
MDGIENSGIVLYGFVENLRCINGSSSTFTSSVNMMTWFPIPSRKHFGDTRVELCNVAGQDENENITRDMDTSRLSARDEAFINIYL